MDHERKRTDKETELNAAKLREPVEAHSNEPDRAERVPPMVDASADETGDGAAEAASDDEDFTASSTVARSAIGPFDNGETAGDPVAAGPVDSPPIVAEAVTDVRNDDDAYTTVFNSAPATEDTEGTATDEGSGPPIANPTETETSPDPGVDTTDDAGTEVAHSRPQVATHAIIPPPRDNSFVVDAASFSAADFGITLGKSHNTPEAAEAPPSPQPGSSGILGDLVHHPGDPKSKSPLLPYVPGSEPNGPRIHDLFDRNPPSDQQNTFDFPSDSPPPERPVPSAIDDGESVLMCPVVLVEVPDSDTRRIIEEALTSAASNDFKTLSEIAKEEVEDAFWVRACHERAVYRD